MGCRWKQRAPTIPLLLPAYFLYTMCLFGNMVLQQELTLIQVCRQVSLEKNDTSILSNCTTNHQVSGNTAEWLGTSDSVLGIVSALTAGTLGGMSDSRTCGRLPVMIIATLGLLGYLVGLLFVAMYNLSPSYVCAMLFSFSSLSLFFFKSFFLSLHLFFFFLTLCSSSSIL